MSSKSFGWYRVLLIVLSILYIFGGILIMMNPSWYAGPLVYMIGVMMLLYGCMMVAAYFMANSFKSIFTLLLGIALIILGILCCTNLWEASIAMGVLCGIGFTLAGAFKVYQSFMIKDFGVPGWWLVLVLGICNLIVGIIMLCNLGASGELISILIGCSLLTNGVSDLMLAFTTF